MVRTVYDTYDDLGWSHMWIGISWHRHLERIDLDLLERTGWLILSL